MLTYIELPHPKSGIFSVSGVLGLRLVVPGAGLQSVVQ